MKANIARKKAWKLVDFVDEDINHWRIQWGAPIGPFSFIFMQFVVKILPNNRFFSHLWSWRNPSDEYRPPGGGVFAHGGVCPDGGVCPGKVSAWDWGVCPGGCLPEPPCEQNHRQV